MGKNLILTLGVTSFALVAAGCGGGGKKAAAETENNRVAVKVAMAEARTVTQEEVFTANIEPWQKNYIIPALQGARIDRIYVSVGDNVRKGQLVAEMDPTQYNTARVQYETAAADYRRIEAVYKAGGVSEQQLRQAEAQYLVYKETVENLARNVKLHSPIDGTISRRDGEEGNLFTSTPILEIMQMDKLKVNVNISEQFFSVVRVGTPVAITAEIFPGETFDGKVSLIYPAIDPMTRTFMVEIEIPNTNRKLRPGMFARSVIDMGERQGVLIPDLAVQRQSGTSERFVYVIADGKAERRFVTVGRNVNGLYDVLTGLSAGETVATTSFTRLENGTQVEIVD